MTQRERWQSAFKMSWGYLKLNQAREAELTHDRQRQSELLRSVEDRAHAEVDRVRQELRSLQKQLEAAGRERQLLQDSVQQREATLRSQLADAQRDAAVARAEARVKSSTPKPRTPKKSGNAAVTAKGVKHAERGTPRPDRQRRT